MPTLKEKILEVLARHPGRTDRELTELIKGRGEPQQPVNIACRDMAERGIVERRKRDDGLIGNYPTGRTPAVGPQGVRGAQKAKGGSEAGADGMSENEVKQALARWLEADGWTVEVAWGRTRGIDIDARRRGERWIVEAKGCGSRPEMRVNYFIGMLGETLQRMDDPAARYSIALPDMPQYRRLWERLPAMAKERTGIGMLFVDKEHSIEVG